MHAVGLIHLRPLWWFGLGPARKLELPAGLLSCYHGFMATVITKKRRGPAPTGKGTLIGVRLQPSQLAALDAWIAQQAMPLTRPEAIRAMMETILHILSKDPGESQPRRRRQNEQRNLRAAPR
jgi:hypothetical protein